MVLILLCCTAVAQRHRHSGLRAAPQAQCILFRRYPGVLEPFKYAGYPLLLQAVTLPEVDADDKDGSARSGRSGQPHWLSPENIPQLQVLYMSACHCMSVPVEIPCTLLYTFCDFICAINALV